MDALTSILLSLVLTLATAGGLATLRAMLRSDDNPDNETLPYGTSF